MLVLNTNFADPNNQTGYPSRKSLTKSGATCFETVDDLGGADGLVGNSLQARSQDGLTNYQPVEFDIKSPCDDGDLACYESNPTWQQQQRDQFKQFEFEWRKSNATVKDDLKFPDVYAPEYNECQCGFDPDCGLAPWQNSGSQSNSTTPLATEAANFI